MQLSTQSGTINISKYVENFLGTPPTILILSSLVSEFDKESKSDLFSEVGGGGVRGVQGQGIKERGERGKHGFNFHE